MGVHTLVYTIRSDPDGFDAQADTVGAGIYGGKVKRDAEGNILEGRQYQNHNPRKGPIYAGTGYTEMSAAIHKGPEAVKLLLARHPELSNDVSTGGASPLHTCGMSRTGQLSTKLLIDAGGGAGRPGHGGCAREGLSRAWHRPARDARQRGASRTGRRHHALRSASQGSGGVGGCGVGAGLHSRFAPQGMGTRLWQEETTGRTNGSGRVHTYGYTPLHRMASNDLAIGAAALIEAGANATLSTGAPYSGDTPMATAQQSSAHAVVDVLRKAGVTH
ncbi:MAG: hypothetical protein WDW36_000010 [Sanguina aurantia]